MPLIIFPAVSSHLFCFFLFCRQVNPKDYEAPLEILACRRMYYVMPATYGSLHVSKKSKEKKENERNADDGGE